MCARTEVRPLPTLILCGVCVRVAWLQTEQSGYRKIWRLMPIRLLSEAGRKAHACQEEPERQANVKAKHGQISFTVVRLPVVPPDSFRTRRSHCSVIFGYALSEQRRRLSGKSAKNVGEIIGIGETGFKRNFAYTHACTQKQLFGAADAQFGYVGAYRF